MNKKQAVAYLGVSERTLEKYVKESRLHVQYVRGKTRPVAVFGREELRRLKKELDEPTHRPAVVESTALVATGPQSLIPQKTVEPRKSPQFPIELALILPHKLTLTLREAALLAGLSRGYLLGAIREGTLKAEKRGRGWNLKRGDLEAWVKKL